MDVVVLGTSYQLEKRSVTGNTYEKTPNDITYELYLDARRGANDELADDHGFHLSLFQRIVDSCASAGVQHAVVIETPITENPEAYLKILNKSNMCFTYMQCKAKWENAKDYTFEKGLTQKFEFNVIFCNIFQSCCTISPVSVDYEVPADMEAEHKLQKQHAKILVVIFICINRN